MSTMKTTYSAKWGSDHVSVSADWRHADEEIKGLPGRQVAEFGHDGWRALRKALEVAARDDGMPLSEREDAIDEAMEAGFKMAGPFREETRENET